MTYEINTGTERACAGYVFEAVEDECKALPGIKMFHWLGYSVGHMPVFVKLSIGDIRVVGDAIFVECKLKPNPAVKWRHWLPERCVNSCEGWKSIEGIDKLDDYVWPQSDATAMSVEEVSGYAVSL